MALCCSGALLAWQPAYMRAAASIESRKWRSMPRNRSPCDADTAPYCAKHTTDSGMQPGLHFVQHTQRVCVCVCGGASKKSFAKWVDLVVVFGLIKSQCAPVSIDAYRRSRPTHTHVCCSHMFVVAIFCLAHLWHEDVLMSPYNEVN